MSATARESRAIRSPRYPGWSIRRDRIGHWTMIHDSGIYAISVMGDVETGFDGELLTKQTDWRTGTKGWEPMRHNAFQGEVPDVVGEAERRIRKIQAMKERQNSAECYDMAYVAKHYRFDLDD